MFKMLNIIQCKTNQYYTVSLSFAASFTGQVSAVIFQPFPPQIVKEKTEVRIDCSHDDTTLLVMLWYQQRENSPSMTLIAYGYQNAPNYEGQFEEQFELTRPKVEKGTLIIKEANLSHSAVYFCAASTQWCGLMPLPYYKP